MRMSISPQNGGFHKWTGGLPRAASAPPKRAITFWRLGVPVLGSVIRDIWAFIPLLLYTRPHAQFKRYRRANPPRASAYLRPARFRARSGRLQLLRARNGDQG